MLVSVEEDYSLFVWDYVNAYIVQTAHISGGHVMDVGVNRVRYVYVCVYVCMYDMYKCVCMCVYIRTYVMQTAH